MRKNTNTNSGASGFSLLELMIVMVIVLVISAAIFQVISLATARSSAEQTKVDMFQEAREFMDQMSRDLRQAGFPNPRNMDQSVFTTLSMSPISYDLHSAAGLVEVTSGDLLFEGDVDGSGSVSVVHYHLALTGNNCPCLQRSQLPKINASPMAQTMEVYQVEVQGVQNMNIFTAYNNGNSVGLPVSVNTTSGTVIAGVDTVQAMLTLQSSNIDPQTHQKPITTLVTTVRLNNCSSVAIGYQTSCQ
jgi:prepilin-type N-terminal cleavage/methylation domain-containing protein